VAPRPLGCSQNRGAGFSPWEIILLLCQGGNSADHALNVFEGVTAQLARSNLIEPALNVVRSRVLQPNLLRDWFEMIFPDVPVALRGGGPLVFRSPRQVHALDKIADCNDPVGWDCATVDGCHVTFGFGLDVRGRTFPACRNLGD
jgi:hypothetical protein